VPKEVKDSIPPLYDEHEEIVSEKGKKVKRRGIFLLPNLFTTASLFSGFFAIISSIDSNFILAGMAIFAAQIFDGLDGRVARLTNAESPFKPSKICAAKIAIPANIKLLSIEEIIAKKPENNEAVVKRLGSKKIPLLLTFLPFSDTISSCSS
jgi:hypothetical protein